MLLNFVGDHFVKTLVSLCVFVHVSFYLLIFIAGNSVADCDSIYSVKVTVAIGESVESTDVLIGKDQVTVCILYHTVCDVV